MQNKILTLIIFVLIVIIAVGGYFIFTELNKQNNSNQTQNTESLTEENNSRVSMTKDKVEVNTKAPDLYNTNVKFTRAEQVYVSEMKFLEQVYNAFSKTNWDGIGSIPVKPSELDTTLYDEILEKEANRYQTLDIPDEYEQLYITDESGEYLQELLLDSRNEFLDFIGKMGVNQKYISEFDTNALPGTEERLKYHATDDPDAPQTAISAWKGSDDPSQREGNFYAVDAYNYARQIENSGLIGDKPTREPELLTYRKTARDMGLRMLAFHEYTHVLQNAYGYVNAKDRDKGKPSIYLYLDKPLNIIDSKYFLEWGTDSNNKVKNNQISEERQAEGISYLAMVSVYNLSPQQGELLWEYRFGRLSDAAKIYNKVTKELNEKYPKLKLAELGLIFAEMVKSDKGLSSQHSRILNRLSNRLDFMGPNGGYFNPMTPNDADAFWKMLSKD